MRKRWVYGRGARFDRIRSASSDFTKAVEKYLFQIILHDDHIEWNWMIASGFRYTAVNCLSAGGGSR